MKNEAAALTRIDRFSGNWGFLSNFYPATVRLYDIWGEEVKASNPYYSPDSACGATMWQPAVKEEIYASVEHAYQAAKFLDAEIRKPFQEPGTTAAKAKAEAKILRWKGMVRKDWNSGTSLVVMKDLLRQKFAYAILRRKLLCTFKAELIEGNWWHDNFYGNCFCEDCADITGQNYLGKLLMEVRDGK